MSHVAHNMSHVTHDCVVSLRRSACWKMCPCCWVCDESWHTWMSHVTHERVVSRRRGARWTTGWQWPIGCLKSQVIFHKRATNYRALLPKMTHKDKASYDSTPSCTYLCCLVRGESWHTWISHITYEWVVTRTNVSHECVTHTGKGRHAHKPESFQNTNESRHTSHYRFAVMGHVTHTNTARHTHERVTHTNESHTNESWHTQEWVMSHSHESVTPRWPSYSQWGEHIYLLRPCFKMWHDSLKTRQDSLFEMWHGPFYNTTHWTNLYGVVRQNVTWLAVQNMTWLPIWHDSLN